MADDDRDIAELLRRLDHQVPDVDVADTIARAGARRRWAVAPIAAAAVVLVVATAAALPFTPVHRALMRAVAAVIDRSGPRTPPAAVTPPVEGTGVALVPDARLTVRFVAPPPGVRLRVVFTAASRASLVPEGGDAAFAVGEDAIVVSDVRAPTFLLTVPQSVDELRVERDGVLLLRKKGSAVVTGAARDTGGAYLVELSSPLPAQ